MLVEGSDDLRAIPHLLETAGVAWGRKDKPIVKIIQCEGVATMLAPDFITTHLKASGLVALGVIVDADNSAQDRWRTIRERVLDLYSDAPSDMPATGVILRATGKPTFGAWIMPDNVNRGMLETFLLFLRPKDNPSLLAYAQEVIQEAKNRGAPFLEQHQDKAEIHSWLAWQDPPGRQLHNAIMERMLGNKHECIESFVAWFQALYSQK
ncbi:MAG: DUF3226 domain-containing protein [Polyangiaceae bacterium]|nr:DUF3226 domain-containing protein [Polyangiaceae bacterium]